MKTLLAVTILALGATVATAASPAAAPARPRRVPFDLGGQANGGFCGYEIPLPPDAKCWVAFVTWREELNMHEGETVVQQLRVTRLDTDADAMFHTRAELQAWVQQHLAREGFWANDSQKCDDINDRCVFVPPAMMERVELRQIVDPPR